VISAEKQNSLLKLSISDSGVGMKPEDIDKLFRIDVHHSTKGTNAESGTGLGLLLCKDFVEMNGGSIKVESTFGEGTTFTIFLPMEDLN
jgi:signal transduction histidine kinase